VVFGQGAMTLVLKKSTVCFLFSLLLIASYPINYPLFLNLRPADIVLLLFAVWGILNADIRLRSVSILIGIFFILLLLSTLYGILFIRMVSPQNFAFIYKYSVLFVCVWLLLSSKLDEPRIRFLLKMLFLSFLVVLAYEYISLYRFRVMYAGRAHTFRPNFPFTDPFPDPYRGYLGDAHLLAAYFSTGLLAIIFCRQYRIFRIRLPFYCGLLAIAFAGMLLTGSRNGVVTFSVTVIFFGLWVLARKVLHVRTFATMRRSTVRLALAILLVGAVVTSLSVKYGAENTFVNRLLNRAVYFDPSKDQSFLGRVNKFSEACNFVIDNAVIIGPGLQSSERSYFDGAIASMLVSSGVGGVCAYVAIIAASFLVLHKKARLNDRQNEFLVLSFVSLNYILANLITEFFLVSRSVIPFAVFYGLMARLIHIPRHSIATGERER
jgi:hypothetical protein